MEAFANTERIEFIKIYPSEEYIYLNWKNSAPEKRYFFNLFKSSNKIEEGYYDEYGSGPYTIPEILKDYTNLYFDYNKSVFFKKTMAKIKFSSETLRIYFDNKQEITDFKNVIIKLTGDKFIKL